MNKNVTRRVAIGTLIGGLATAPFVFRVLRNTNPVLPELSSEIDRKQEILFQKIAKTNGISVDQVVKSLNYFKQAKINWQSFCGLDAHVQLMIEGKTPEVEEWKSRTQEGFLSLKIKKRESINQDESHWEFHLKYFTPDKKDQIWSYSTYSNFEDTEFKGDREEINSPEEILNIITNPFCFFTSTWTEIETIVELLAIGTWGINLDQKTKNAEDSFSFINKETESHKEKSWPSLYFQNGNLYCFSGMGKEDENFTMITENYISQDDFVLPTKYINSFIHKSPDIEIKHHINLMDVSINS
jgi:hypothetical protein